MLTAWDKVRETTLALPDFEDDAALARVRDRTRQGELLCPTCRQTLWVHAGEILIPHFAHRRLSDCPLGRVSEAVLAARRLLYRFFQARIESGKLPAEIVLEPVIAGLPKNVRVDLMLRRAAKTPVNVVLIDRGLKPDLRAQLRTSLGRQGSVFRPVFLSSRLKHPEDEPEQLLLDTTQREFRLRSDYDLWPPEHWPEPGTLHFIDPAAGAWTTWRGVSLLHDPQIFESRTRRDSPMDRLLWSEGHVEWVHEGEAEALKKFRAALAERKRRQSRPQPSVETALARLISDGNQSAAKPAPTSLSKPDRREESAPPATGAAPFLEPERPLTPSLSPIRLRTASAGQAGGEGARRAGEGESAKFIVPARFQSEQGAPQEPEPLPAWMGKGLVCVGCGQRTTDWQNAAPGKDQCVCRKCFAAGVRLRPG